MPVLSLYEFEREAPDRAGPFRETHLSFEGPAVLELGTGEPQSLLVRVREAGEEVLDLFELFNTAAARAELEALVAPRLHVLGPIRVSYVSWERARLQPLAPLRRAEGELLATLNAEFHAALPAALDVDGTLTYYFGFWIEKGGALRGAVDGATFHFRGGLAASGPSLARVLQRAMRTGVAPVRRRLEEALRAFARGRAFRRVDLLPGRGGRSGRRRWGNADRQVVLAAVPA
jgi:hypothetical protein